MSKKNTTPTTTTTPAAKLGETLKSLKDEMAALRKQFRTELQKLYDDFRAGKKAIREKRTAAWKEFEGVRAERKAASKAAPAKPAAKKAATKTAKKAAKKSTKKSAK